ncbi:MarR family winged helix-turn-helix transcriptional regulator [Shimia sp. SDUM112013]|uniref:MarR family winged helix-turn-helix transcriptional regulator n=1 Tax=Shimia sp. SDUM112013 TaxID=3136160 RepID=UPI0032EF8B56
MTDHAPPPSLLDQMLCFEIYSTEHAFGRLYKDLLTPLGLTYPQFLVMIFLWEQDGRMVREIGAALGLESNTLTPMIKRLEAAGFVKRTRDTRDERRVLVGLTPMGDQLRHEVGHIRACVTEATGMSEAELRTLFTSLKTLRKALETASGGSG